LFGISRAPVSLGLRGVTHRSDRYSASLSDDDAPLFQFHMLFGIVAVFLLALRMVLGLVGSRYSRFTSFPVHPREVVGYMASAAISKTKLYAGNHPGSAVAAVLMFLLVPALFITGLKADSESAEELHEVFAWALLAGDRDASRRTCLAYRSGIARTSSLAMVTERSRQAR